jgi:uncharacterized protein (DUF169 family)
MEVKEIEEKLNYHVRPQTYPIAIGFVDEKDIPAGFRRPKRDFGYPIPLCQGFSMARRYGWQIAMAKEDHQCPTGAVSTGIVAPKKRLVEGEFKIPPWEDNKEERAKVFNPLPKLPYRKGKTILLSPLRKTRFEPELIILYGNPAQVQILVEGLHKIWESHPMISSCNSLVAVSLLNNDHNIAIPCPAERQVAATQDDEMAYAIPASKLDELLKGLDKLHAFGLRYPTATYLQYQPFFPPSYAESMAYLCSDEDEP